MIEVLTVAFALCWCFMIKELAQYAIKLVAFYIGLSKTPDCCMCGADMDGHSVFDNHAPLSSRDWFIDNCHPRIN